MGIARKGWKLLVAIKDGLVLILMLLFFGGLYAALSISPHSDSATDGALLLDLGGSIVEQPVEPGLGDLLAGGPITRDYRLRDVLHALDQAAGNDRIKAVALDLDIFTGGGQAALANVGDALERVKRTGKPVIAYATAYSDDTYQLAAHASEVWLDPLGGVLIAGRGGPNLYYAGLLERLGITANVYRVGAYKAAVEPFTRTGMSPEAREAAQALAESLWENWLEDVKRARPKADLVGYVGAPQDRVAAAGGDMAQAALRAGLVDRIGDRTEYGRRLAELAGEGAEAVPGSFRAVTYDAWLADHPPAAAAGTIGVLTVAGNIVDGPADIGTAGAETVVENLETGLREHDLKALVVRVDSPGGSTTASERIRRALVAVRERGIPVVISFGSVAASGGYWIATAGDHIMAEPSTITGSIGVFGILPSFEGTLAKLGLNADGVQTTPLTGEPDLLRGPSPIADRLIQMGVENIYGRFIRLVAEARDMPARRVNEIAQGRVWAGGTARQLGLVDQFGSLDAAVAEAARRAGIDPAQAAPVYLEAEPDLFAQMIASAARQDRARAARDPFAKLARRPEQVLQRLAGDMQAMVSGPAIQAWCLECPAPAPVRAAAAEPRPAFLDMLRRLTGF